MRLILIILATAQARLASHEMERAEVCRRWVDAAQDRAAARLEAAAALLDRARAYP